MDEIRWQFNQINWTLYREPPKVYGWQLSVQLRTATELQRKQMWSPGWQTGGLRAEDTAKLFRDAEEIGEAAVTVSRLYSPPLVMRASMNMFGSRLNATP